MKKYTIDELIEFIEKKRNELKIFYETIDFEVSEDYQEYQAIIEELYRLKDLKE